MSRRLSLIRARAAARTHGVSHFWDLVRLVHDARGQSRTTARLLVLRATEATRSSHSGCRPYLAGEVRRSAKEVGRGVLECRYRPRPLSDCRAIVLRRL